MKPFVLPLADLKADIETVGGKGMSLARLSQAGLPVPGGFHVTTEAYRYFVDTNGLYDRIQQAIRLADSNDPASLEPVSVSIARLFREGSIPQDLATAILDGYETMRIANPAHTDVPVAIRSSATAEDLPNASFAGQQETYLNIRGEEAVLESVKKCWASLWTARALAYRLTNYIDQKAIALAVVVQEMVFADAAGVMFTANPVNGHRNETVINSAWGLGESIVSGVVTPDTLTVDRFKKKIIHREIAEKLVMTVRTETGTEEQPVPEKRRKVQVLATSRAMELTQLGSKIEALYGVPMDIEWTILNGSFQIVQARPITNLAPEWSMPYPDTVYARGSLAEHIPSPVTPMFATLGLMLANQATTKMWNRVLGESASKAMMVGEGMYTAINGFVYGGMRMGFKESIMITRLSVLQVGPMLHRSVERWLEARKNFQQVVETWEQYDNSKLTSTELVEGIREIFGAACVYFTDIQSCIPAATMSEMILTRFYNGLVKRKGDPEITCFLLGFDTKGLDTEKSLFDLADWIRNELDMLAWFQNTDSEIIAKADIAEGVSDAIWQEWHNRFENHLKKFGNTVYEFDFVNPTPIESPAALVESIKTFLSGKAANPYERQKAAIARREEATNQVIERLIWPVEGWFTQLLHWAQKTNPMREDSISDMGMGHPVIRNLFAELGRRLMLLGGLEHPQDIYWLEESELKKSVEQMEHNQSVSSYSALILERKVAWKGYLKLSPPILLPENSRLLRFIHESEPEYVSGKTVLRGIGTSSGTVTAPACILYGPEDFGRMNPGNVLVAVTTTPAWTPLFTMASAVVTDIGGPLSHSSIVAREYNIPAVMGARGATRKIQQGQVITVDGAKGTVQF